MQQTNFATLLLSAAFLSSWARPSGSYRYVPKPTNLEAFLDGNGGGGMRTAAHLPRSASTFFASQIRDRAYDRRPNINNVGGGIPAAKAEKMIISKLPESDNSAAAEAALADETEEAQAQAVQQQQFVVPNGAAGTELAGGRLSGNGAQKGSGQFARKNCFFSPLQCSFYYKKRSHQHHRHKKAIHSPPADEQ